MECAQCQAAARVKDSKIGLPFCGIHCQKAFYIAGGMCKNEDDVDMITQEPFSTMPPKEIITINDYCYHLPSLYRWVAKDPPGRDLVRNMPFSEDEVGKIKAEAKTRYPLSIPINTIMGKNAKYESTGLSTVPDFVVGLTRTVLKSFANSESDITTVREALQKLVDSGFRLIVAKLDGTSTGIVDLLSGSFDDQVYLAVPNVKSIMLITILTPPAALSQVTAFANFIRDRLHQPVPQSMLDRKKMLEKTLSDVERERIKYEELQARIRPLRAARDASRIQPPDTEVVGISINTPGGSAYGSFDIYLPRNAVLGDAEPLIRAEANGIFSLPNRPMRFIFAGRLYSLNTPLAQVIGNLQGKITLHVTF